MLLKNTPENIKVLKNRKDNFIISDDNLVIFTTQTNTENLSDIIEHKQKYSLVSNKFQTSREIFLKNNLKVDFEELMMIAGPCSIKNEETLMNVAEKIKNMGIKYFRAGAYKPRTSPHDFQGFEEEGLQILKKVKEKFNLFIVSEIMDASDIEKFDGIVDIFQVGARNMQNFTLLKALGKTNNAILLKRGLSATMEEFVLAAEYIIAHGNSNVILCERGIRSYENHTRNTFDVSVIPFVKQNTNLPIIVDPSHAVGIRNYVESMSYAGIAAGADGLIIEADIDPLETNTDIEQTISLEKLHEIELNLQKLAPIVGKKYGKNK